ncbi:histidine--tRNA ligase [Candidatus Dependentiae bacterium HGW-Dependentiae-1]|nr:MAG: histidine--tRNA ligase [Candidatus Dependentiae bacterium HGW-Dependentiae-1]
MAFTRIKGTQDFLDLALFNFFIKKAKDHLQLYHFSEIATPLIEPVELFQRSLGEQSDIISKEMFLIASGENKEERICLRPEGTASTVRAFIENNIQQTPWKIFLYGPMFRYERPQKGRYRQFHQFNMEVIGSAAIAQDAQFIKMLERFFHETLKLNSYTIDLNFLGCLDDRSAYREVLYAFLMSAKAEGICQTCKVRREKNIMRVFDCKSPVCQEIYKNAPYIADHLCTGCAAEWQELQEELDLLSVSYSYRPSLVRGLDYYSKTVFEFSSGLLGAQNAFCGGGRYDMLAKELGAKEDQPSIGAAIGIERLLLLLETIKDRLPIEQAPALHVIVPLGDEQKKLGLLLADELQAKGLCTDILLEGASAKSMMRQANKVGAAYCLILGDDEQKTRTVTVKNMVTGTEERIAQIDVVSHLKK